MGDAGALSLVVMVWSILEIQNALTSLFTIKKIEEEPDASNPFQAWNFSVVSCSFLSNPALQIPSS